MSSVRSYLCCLLVLLPGCGPDRQPPASDLVDADSVAAARGPLDASSPAARDAWTLSHVGADGVRIGMRVSELSPLLAPGVDPATIGQGCEYVRLEDAPDSVGVMVHGGRVARIDVRGGTTRTAEGAGVGDTEEQILALYPGARRQPHKYVDGSYLIVSPDAPADTMHRYVFETDGERVTSFRGGIVPQVEWVEGCS